MLSLLATLLFSGQVASSLVLAWPARLPPPSPDACGYDAYEPNDDRPHAHRLTGVAADGRLCRGDADWYAIHLGRGERVRIGLLHDRDAAPAPPTVFPPGQRKSVGRPYRADGEVGAQLTAAVEGWYRVRVTPASDEISTYVLLVWPAGLDPPEPP